MKIQHTPYHWVLVALTLAALLFVLREAHGQSTGASAMFEGRPAMAGAQGGMGAQAGMPQGGIGVQGTAAAERGLRIGAPSGLDEMRQAKRDGQDMVSSADKDMTVRKEVSPARDTSVAKEQRSAAKKVRKAAKRTLDQARYGSSPFGTTASAKP
jgi:hypothetical protein